jgi:hypothetical protein
MQIISHFIIQLMHRLFHEPIVQYDGQGLFGWLGERKIISLCYIPYSLNTLQILKI